MTSDQKPGGIANALLHGLVLLLVLSFWLPEIRVGLSGFSYPPPGAEFGADAPFARAGLPWVFEILIILMVPTFILGLLLGELSFNFNWAVVAILILCCLAVFVIPLSYIMGLKESGAAFGHKRFTFESYDLLLMVSQMKWSYRNLRRVVWVFIGAAVFHSVVVLLSSRNINFLPLPPAVSDSGELARYAGLFSQPSRFSLFVSMGTVLIYALIIRQRPIMSLKQILLIGCMLICLAGVALGQTRAAFVGIPLVLILATYGSGKSSRTSTQVFQKTFLIGAVLGGIILFVLVTNLSPYFSERFGSRFIEQQETGARGLVWPLTLETIIHYPLGIGYVPLNYINKHNLGHAHNLFLQVAVMFGIPALVIFIYFLVKLFRGINSLEYNDLPGIEYVTAIKWAVAVFLINGMFEPFFITNVGIYFWLFAGILVAYIQRYSIKSYQPRKELASPA